MTTGPTPMEGVERTNTVIVGAPQGGTPTRWKWIGGRTAMLAGDLGTWLVIAETEEEEG